MMNEQKRNATVAFGDNNGNNFAAKKRASVSEFSDIMTIACTGIRSGEWITGTTKATLNTTMQVIFKDKENVFYPPHVDCLKSMVDTDFRDKLNNLSFFKEMSPSERKAWIVEHARDDLFYLNDIPNVFVRLFSVGGNKIVDENNPNAFDDLMDGKLHPLSKLFRRISGGEKTRLREEQEEKEKEEKDEEKEEKDEEKEEKDEEKEEKDEGCVGGRHSLSFRGSLWKVKPESLDVRPDIFCNLIGGQLSLSTSTSTSTSMFAVEIKVNPYSKSEETQVIGVMDAPHGKPFRKHNWNKLSSIVPSLSQWEPYFEMLSEHLNWFSPAIHKSLIQKLIRTRCTCVRLFDGTIVPAQAVMFASFVLLVTHAGTFVPDIRRFVRGSESAFKRVAVAMAEDSFASCETITSMLAAALVAQMHPNFEPSEELVAFAIEESIRSQQDTRAWKYETVILPNSQASEVKWRYPYYLLNAIGSFASDIGLVQSIGLNPNKLVDPSEYSATEMFVMKIEYCLDQHSLTNIAHLFKPRQSPKCFEDIFKHLWVNGTGRNVRKHRNIAEEDKEIATAQRLMWMCKQKQETNVLYGNEPVPFKLDWSWMAGMLEKMSVMVTEKRRPVMVHVFAHPESEGRFMAIRPASREKAAEELSEDTKEAAIAVAKGQLETVGKLVKNRLIGIEGRVFFRDEQFWLLPLGEEKEKPWSSCYDSTVMVSMRPAVFTGHNVMDDVQFEACCEYMFTAANHATVTENWESHVQCVLQSISPAVCDRLRMYVRPLKQVIEMYRISRDGSSTYLMTSWKDTVVLRALMFISSYVPGVLSPDSNLRFRIHDYRIWSTIRTMILQHKCVQSAVPVPVHVPVQTALDRFTGARSEWSSKLEDKRTLYAHQEAAVEQICTRVREGRRGNLIWIPVGLGKTLIVSTVLQRLIANKEMPNYCVYTLPPSAIDSVTKEFEKGGFHVHRVVYKTNRKTVNNTHLFRPHCINLIAHDNMRVAADHLVQLAPDCFFVIDEFHLTMNDTKRTSIALEVAKLSHNFIGLTGTLIKDKQSKGVIEWVSQVVEFEVNERNYWVAIAALISRKTPLQISQERVFVEAEMYREEKEEYNRLVEPKFGGHAMRTDFHNAIKICYKTLQRSIIDFVLTKINPTRPVFVVAKDTVAQGAMRDAFESKGLRVFCIGVHSSITLTPSDSKTYDIVITTCTHCTGFTLTQADTMVSAVYFSNQATRDQLEGRLIRVGQTAPVVSVYILHTGLLTYTMKHYEDARSLRRSLEDLAEDVMVDDL